MRTRTETAAVFYMASLLTAGAAGFVRWKLVVPGDAASTATHILTHEALFQMLLPADLISTSCFVAVTLLLCDLLKPASPRLSTLTAFLSFLSYPIMAFASLFHIAAFAVLRGAQQLNLLRVPPLSDLAMACLELQARAHGISLMVFAVCCALLALGRMK